MERQLSGGAAIIAALEANGIKALFGLPGAQIYPLFDGLYGSDIDLFVPRHEQAAGYMAMGYAKSTGQLGVFAVVPGPGVLNASAALCTAAGNCSPLLCLTGQVPSAFLGKGRGHLHELRDQVATLKTLIKDARRIDDPESTIQQVNEAMLMAQSGRPGPVSIEMCWDTMAAEWPVEMGPGHGPIPKPEPDPEAIDAAVRLIATARKPMIMCGAGAQGAAAEVRQLAACLGAPVTAFRSGRGVVSEDDDLGIASVAARELWDDVDVLIGIGSRLEMPFMRWRNPMRCEGRTADGPRLVRIDIDPTEMDRLQADVGIVADAGDACRLLANALQHRVRPNAERPTEIAAARQLADSLIAKIQPQAEYLRVIRSVLPRDGFLIPELSQAGFTTYTGAFPVLEPRTYVTEGYQGTLGFGFPTALGVKVAHPDRAVVSITGDGGFLFGVGELATAVQYQIGVVVIVFNNNAYGNVLRDQQQLNGHVVGSKLDNPDFMRLAEAFGVAGTRVDSPAQLEAALERALTSSGPTLIEVLVDLGEERSPWPLIHMNDKPSRLRL